MKPTLYVNGDSHTAGTYLKDKFNFDRCFSAALAKKYNLNHLNEALAGGSNNRIIRVSKEYLRNADPSHTLVLIGWSTFERTEWLVDSEWQQICGQPSYEIKTGELAKHWKEYIDKVWNDPNWILYHARSIEWQYNILNFHLWLKSRNFKHLFFHAHKDFSVRKVFQIGWPDNLWLGNNAYDSVLSFTQHSERKGHKPDWAYHFSFDAHEDYAKFIEKDFVKAFNL